MQKFYLDVEQRLNSVQLKQYVDSWKASTEYRRLKNLESYYNTQNTTIMNRQLANSDINNKVSTGYAKYIVNVCNGYMLGSKDCISYVFNDNSEEFARILKYNDSVSVDRQLGQDASIYGYGIEQYWLDTTGEFRFTSINPKNVLLFFDDTIEENITQALKYREFEYIDELGLIKNKMVIEYYTMDTIFEYTFEDNAAIPKEVIETPNIFGDIPFSIYHNPDDAADFENVITLIDAIDKALADTSNMFEYYSDALN